MPRMNFGSVPFPEPGQGGQDLRKPIPPGKYRVVCTNCDVAYSAEGIELWKLKLEVIDGEYAGKWLFDNMAWGSIKSEKTNLHALSRCKLICHRLGGLRVDEAGELDVQPQDLLQKTAVVTVEIEQRDYKTGTLLPPEKQRNKIAFDGYDFDGIPEQGSAPERSPDADDVPF